MPEYLLELKTKKKSKKKEEHIKNKQAEQIDRNSVQLNNIQNAETNGERDTDECSYDTEKLRQDLIKKINSFSQKKKFSVSIAEENILNFRFENQSFRCTLQCPKCNKLVPCNYVTNWICGNFQSHLKSHVTVELYEVNDNNILEKVHQVNPKIVRLADKSQLKNILES